MEAKWRSWLTLAVQLSEFLPVTSSKSGFTTTESSGDTA
jgi:hypothetical protein